MTDSSLLFPRVLAVGPHLLQLPYAQLTVRNQSSQLEASSSQPLSCSFPLKSLIFHPVNNHTILHEIKEEMSRYHAAACELIHEKVMLAKNSMPAEDDPSVTQPGLPRLGFCNASDRQWRLTCAHTMAASRFNRLLGQLADTGLVEADRIQFEKINALLTEIYLLDHQKGNVEKDYAVLRQQSASTPELQSTREKLNQIIRQHTILVRQVEALREEILGEVEAAGEKLRAASF